MLIIITIIIIIIIVYNKRPVTVTLDKTIKKPIQ